MLAKTTNCVKISFFVAYATLCCRVIVKAFFGEVEKKLEPENFHSFKCKIIKTNVSMLRELPDLVNMPSVAQVVAATQTVQLDTFLIFWWSLTGNSIFFPLRSFSAAMTQVCVPSEANFQNIYLCSFRLLVHNEQREPQLNTSERCDVRIISFLFKFPFSDADLVPETYLNFLIDSW